ncbi:MAG: DNA primase [Casimicrobiaceae bacterium]|nr:DNA primase [Casimicrobiaceae bacterium]MCX8098721.1 DNA primase [Casimicrobiaceae bacterium]MDW8312160.1 DNA primase [Burkholderiales bacterium]
MIAPEFIAQLLARVDIVEVIERRVPLKKAGQNYVACCPFHKEKTPSFTVSPTKQFFHCFGCGAHGSAIGFLMDYAGMSFRDAVAELAQSVGLRVPAGGAPQQSASPSPLLAVLARAQRFYAERLRESPAAIDYLKRRGVSADMARRFQLGWAPEGWQPLAAVFENYAADPLLERAGLVSVSEGGRRYDRFRARLMFPILNARGAVIGFGGRLLGDAEEGGPKYLNSPETAVFSKGRELYGLFQAQAEIRRTGRVIVVEGYLDVIALAEHGLGNVVATLGTATTGAHAERLLRLADDVVFAFDGDAAGERAAWRAFMNVLPVLSDGKQVRFLFLPPEHDPDSYVRANGREAFERLVEQAVPLSAYWLERLRAERPGDTAEARAARAALGRRHLDEVAAPLLRASLARALAADTHLPVETVLGAIPQSGTNAPGSAQKTVAGPRGQTPHFGEMPSEAPAREGWREPRPVLPRFDPVEQRLRLAARRLLFRPMLARHLEGLRIPSGTGGGALALLFAIVEAAGRLGPQATAGAVAELLRESEFAEEMRRLLTDRDNALDEQMSEAEIAAELGALRERIESGLLTARPQPVVGPAGRVAGGIVSTLVPQRRVEAAPPVVEGKAPEVKPLRSAAAVFERDQDPAARSPAGLEPPF